jgi:hypothetical protein
MVKSKFRVVAKTGVSGGDLNYSATRGNQPMKAFLLAEFPNWARLRQPGTDKGNKFKMGLYYR